MSTSYEHPNPDYQRRMDDARARLATALTPQNDQERAIVEWLGKFDLPTLETLSQLVERRVRTAARAARMQLAQEILDSPSWDSGYDTTAYARLEHIASGGDPELPRPLREWGTSSVNRGEDQ